MEEVKEYDILKDHVDLFVLAPMLSMWFDEVNIYQSLLKFWWNQSGLEMFKWMILSQHEDG